METNTGPRADLVLLKLVGWGAVLSVGLGALILTRDWIVYGNGGFEEPFSFRGFRQGKTFALLGFVTVASALWAFVCSWFAAVVRKSDPDGTGFVRPRVLWIVLLAWLIAILNVVVVGVAGAGDGRGVDGNAEAVLWTIVVLMGVCGFVQVAANASDPKPAQSGSNG